MHALYISSKHFLFYFYPSKFAKVLFRKEYVLQGTSYILRLPSFWILS